MPGSRVLESREGFGAVFVYPNSRNYCADLSSQNEKKDFTAFRDEHTKIIQSKICGTIQTKVENTQNR